MENNKLIPKDIMTIATVFSQSGMFTDTKHANQAFVKIMAGQEMGIPPFAAMSGVHIIKGKPTIGAGLIASTVKGSAKYDYKVVEQTDKICSIDFYEGKQKIGNSSFTIEEAKKAGTQNLEKFPKNMLFARAISNGVKWYCPDVFSGPVYTPEEMSQETIDTEYEEIVDKDDAIKEMDAVQTLEDLKNVWSKYKTLQTDEDFVNKKDERKEELSKPLDSDGTES